MGVIGEKLDVDFVISTGDNFYEDGLTGEDDPAFSKSFTDIYTAPSLQKPWYNGSFRTIEIDRSQLYIILKEKDKAELFRDCRQILIKRAFFFFFFFILMIHLLVERTVLGNHDYRGDVEAQLSPVLREKDSRWICFRSYILNAGKFSYGPS